MLKDYDWILFWDFFIRLTFIFCYVTGHYTIKFCNDSELKTEQKFNLQYNPMMGSAPVFAIAKRPIEASF